MENANVLHDSSFDNNVNRIAEKHEYNVDKIDDFLNIIFPELAEDENILTWMSNSNIPGYPISDSILLDKLDRIPLPKALYYSTATASRHEDGGLYNRKDLFKRLCVLVLDDIGTKIPKERIPEALKPTYIIESSEGNYQYGYVLKEPIDQIELAQALIEVVYSAGVSDSGGKMVNKLVRLPDGINGKKGDKGRFRVTLTELNEDTLWTPEDILNILDTKVKWPEIVKNTKEAMHSIQVKNRGLSVWSPLPSQASTLDGIVDPLYEWLLEKGLVKQDTGEWVAIECPWKEFHTSGGDTASYSPLGYGQGIYRNRRSFNCFHDHCSEQHTSDFLAHMETLGAPRVPVHETNMHLFKTYAYDKQGNGLWEVDGRHKPVFMSVASAANVLVDNVFLNDRNGNPKVTTELNYFLKNSRHKVIVHGVTYDPSTKDKIVTDTYGNLAINMFYTPDWGVGDCDMKIVEEFTNYLKYLIPDEKDYEFFMDWLAAKVQNMGFRGQAIIMVALTQGMGRTTLGKMLGVLFGEANMESVPFETLTGDSAYNDWQGKPIIVTDETLAIAKDDNKYKVYERLKEKVDTTPKMVRINPKYGMQREQMCYTSYLMFSNHTDAMVMAKNDRRFRIIMNAHDPADAKYFSKINNMLDAERGENYWARHVWRHLNERKVDSAELLKPAEMTQAKVEMLSQNMSPLDIVLHVIFDNWPYDIIATFMVKEILKPYLLTVAAEMPEKTRNSIINRAFRANTINLHEGHKYRFNPENRVTRYAVISHRRHEPKIKAIMVSKLSPQFNTARVVVEEYKDCIPKINEKIRSALELADII